MEIYNTRDRLSSLIFNISVINISLWPNFVVTVSNIIGSKLDVPCLN